MIRLASLCLVVLALAAFLIGWLSNPTQNNVVSPITGSRLNVQHVAAPGTDILPAADYMLSLNPPPPPPAPPKPAVTTPPPPPPIDISVVFRRELSAIIPVGDTQNGKPGIAAVLADNSGGLRKVRTLKLGDEFQDGWRLVALSRQTALLRKAKDQRTIVFFGPPVPLPPSALPKPLVAPRAISPNLPSSRSAAPPLAVPSRPNDPPRINTITGSTH